MNKIFFITGNRNKFSEVEAILAPEITVQQLDIDLPEIQSLDSKEIIKAKLKEASAHHGGEFFVEDVSFEIIGLKGLPGPLVKWFIEAVGVQGIFDMADKSGNATTTARSTIGYSKSHDEIYFFEGSVEGRVVAPRIEAGFQFDRIFVPSGNERTLAEMTQEEKNAISHRFEAVKKLKKFILKNKQ